MPAPPARAEPDRMRASRALRGPPRGPGRLLLLALFLLAAGGVAVAGVLRPDLDPPAAEAEHAAATGTGAGEEAISLDELARRPSAPDRDDSEGDDPPPTARSVIGVGTDEFAASAVGGDIEDVDGYDPGQARPPSDAEIRSELADFRDHLEGLDPRKGARAYIDKDGRAVLPKGAPRTVALVVAAANEIATKPYKWGGGHGAWKDSGYDCSGSVSFALAGARLLDSPLASGGFVRYGKRGPGRWISIYTHSGHMFMTVAGLRFDTSGQGAAGTRWQRGTRSTSGYTVRHPPGL